MAIRHAGIDQSQSNTFLDIAGPAGEGSQDLEPGPALDKLPAAQDFARRYKARFNQDIELYAPFAYDAARAMLKAIQDANSTDRQKIVDSLAKVDINGVTGRIAFDPHGDLIRPPYALFEVRKGQWQSVKTIAATGSSTPSARAPGWSSFVPGDERFDRVVQ